MPRLSFNSSVVLTDFLLENLKLQLDDTYIQDISEKGAGVQRASLVMLSIYLLNQIYTKQNKLILLDEPEAFLYPLLEEKLKAKLEKAIIENSNLQILVTTHSRTFLKDLNNSSYSFYSISQIKEKREYQRSSKELDINKYSIIETVNQHIKYQMLKNYGMLDDVNDYEYVIVCEGKTDKNYIVKILEDKSHIPQIRYSKYSFGNNGDEDGIYYNSSGAGAIPPILLYLDNVSDIKRKVFVLLDGDSAGKDIARKINPDRYRNLTIKIFVLPENKQIEDMVFEREVFIERVLDVEPNINKYIDSFRDTINRMPTNKSVIEQTKDFISGLVIEGVEINKIKNLISQNLDNIKINKKWLLDEIDNFFYKD